MNTDADHAGVVLDRADCQMLAQGLLVFARRLLDDCRRDVGEKGTPAEVASQARRLEAMAERIGQADAVNASFDGLIFALERNEPCLALRISPTDWRVAAAALVFMAERVRAAGDRANGERLQDLAEKVEGAAGWCESFLGCLRKLEETAAKLPQDEAAVGDRAEKVVLPQPRSG